LTEGTSERPPEWLIRERRLVKAARYLGVKVWELAEQPDYWVDTALFHQTLDNELQEAAQGGGT
jgi:hypothetical protein